MKMNEEPHIRPIKARRLHSTGPNASARVPGAVVITRAVRITTSVQPRYASAVRRVDYIIRFVQDLDASVAFYRDVLGIPPRVVGDGYVEFDTDNVKFGLYERGKLFELIGTRPAPNGPDGEVVFVVEDVDAWARRLRDSGTDLLSEPTDRPWGHRTLHLSDPDGLIVELAQEIPRASED
jgi:lactoylglutathione lyase